MSLTAKAILWLVSLPQFTAVQYSQLIEEYSKHNQVDPLLVVALIYVESSFLPKARSQTNDFGLLQIHVSKTTNPEYLGREPLLFHVPRNIQLGTEMLAYWRKYHFRKCRSGKHFWWAHYNWGHRVRNNRYGKKVKILYNKLIRKFRRDSV